MMGDEKLNDLIMIIAVEKEEASYIDLREGVF